MLWALGGLALIGIILAIMFRFRWTAPENVPTTPGQRLLAHSRDRNDYRLFVGVPLAKPTAWSEVVRMDDFLATLRNAPAVKLPEITAFFVTYPSGVLVDYVCPNSLPVPKSARLPDKSEVPDRDELTAADLKAGQSLVRVTFGKSTSKPGTNDHYSTTLTNGSQKRVRVLKFGGYRKSGKVFALSTIYNRFFTAEEFKEWYGQRNDWIDPGESVTDPNNYGRPPMLWAYYCEVEGSEKFLTGGILD